jgi:ABC-type branched-subunit amino acid transport system permease subunit
MAFTIIVYLLLNNLDFTGGPDGISGIPYPQIGGFSFGTNYSKNPVANVLLGLPTGRGTSSVISRSRLSLEGMRMAYFTPRASNAS